MYNQIKQKLNNKKIKKIIIIIEKPEARQKYVQRILDEELSNIIYEDELLFDEYTRNYIVVSE